MLFHTPRPWKCLLNGEPKLILVVDDDRPFLDSLEHLLEAHGFEVRAFRSVEDFLAGAKGTDAGGVALVDLRMPGRSGFDLLGELQREPGLAVVMMTGHGDVPLAVRAIQQGAVEFLEKPFSEQRLLRVLESAFDEVQTRVEFAVNEKVRADRLAQLSPRENIVLKLVSRGKNSKQIANDLGLSVRTVEMHRRNLVRRLNLRTMAEAIALYLEAGNSPD